MKKLGAAGKARTTLVLHRRVLARVKQRGNVSLVINRDLDRLYDLYQLALREIDLTVDEACLLIDVLNGSLMDVMSAKFLWAVVEDSLSLGYAEVWEVDGRALVEKLKKLNIIQCLALIDAAERFWHMVEENLISSDLEEMRQQVAKLFAIREKREEE